MGKIISCSDIQKHEDLQRRLDGPLKTNRPLTGLIKSLAGFSEHISLTYSCRYLNSNRFEKPSWGPVKGLIQSPPPCNKGPPGDVGPETPEQPWLRPAGMCLDLTPNAASILSSFLRIATTSANYYHIFASYNAHLFAQIFEGKLTMRIIRGQYRKYVVSVLVICNYLLHKISCTICSKIYAKIPL